MMLRGLWTQPASLLPSVAWTARHLLAAHPPGSALCPIIQHPAPMGMSSKQKYNLVSRQNSSAKPFSVDAASPLSCFAMNAWKVCAELMLSLAPLYLLTLTA